MVDKNSVLDIIRPRLNSGRKGSLEYQRLYSIYKSVEELPDMIQNEWNPIEMKNGSWTEESRLPEDIINSTTMDFQEYEVTFQSENICEIRHYKYGKGHWWHGGVIVDKYVTAWRERPNPYNSEKLSTGESIDFEGISQVLKNIRNEIVSKYGRGTDLCGHCIEASDMIVAALHRIGYQTAKTVEGWCIYDDGSFCSDCPWDPHTWVELPFHDRMYYLDVTADQFNYGMDSSHKFAEIVFQEGLPHGIQYDEPSQEDYEKKEY